MMTTTIKFLIAVAAAFTGITASFAALSQEPPSTEEIMREDASELTPYSPAGATARRDTRGSPCMYFEPFELLPCGPSTSISLALMPGIYATLEATTTQGGQTAQIVDQLMASGRATEPGTMQELARQEDAVDGASVTITIPLIDYGFQGSFSNAAINMSRANRREHDSIYQAVGPRDSVPGPGHAFPLTGKVTIEEYTPWVLRGTFSGAMVDLEQSDLTVDDPVLNVIYNLSGRFNVIGPWRGDDRAELSEPDDLNRSIREDVGSLFDFARGGDAPNAAGGASAPVNAGGGATGSGASCDCSCNAQDAAPPACQSRCAGTFQACRGEPADMISEQEMAELSTVDHRVAAYSAELRERFSKFLEQRWGDNPRFEELRAGYLESFDDTTSLDAKVITVFSAGMPPDCPPPEDLADRMKMAALVSCPAAQRLKEPN